MYATNIVFYSMVAPWLIGLPVIVLNGLRCMFRDERTERAILATVNVDEDA